MNLNFTPVKVLFFLLVVISTFITNTSATVPGWLWAKSSTYSISKTALDRNGNLFVTGNFSDTIVMGGDTLISSGSSDILIAKLDSAGNVLWAIHEGGLNYDVGNGIGIDDSGYVYVGGYYSEDILNATNAPAYFSGHLFPTAGVTDLFLVKYDTDGNYIWGRHAGGVADDYCEDISVDHSGSCYITGSYGYDTHFGSGGYSATFDFVTLQCFGQEDLYVAKYDRVGNLLWTEQGTGLDHARSFSIDHDNSGNAYITGTAFGSVLFDTTVVGHGGGGLSYFLAKCNALGWDWAVDAEGDDELHGADLCTDDFGNLYVVGTFNETIYLTPDTFDASTNQHSFLIKYDLSGFKRWAIQIFSNNFASVSAIHTLNDGSFIFIGTFNDSLSISGQILVTDSNALENIFICKMDSSGSVESLMKLSATGYAEGFDFAVLDSQNFYLAGNFNDSITIGPFILTGNGDTGFLARYGIYSTVEVNNLPKENWLNIFPNPVSSYGTFGFFVNEKGYVKVDLADQSGIIIKNIQEGIFNPGYNEINFNINSLPGGIYYLKTQTKEYTILKKFILIN